jgi:uncharacterized protein (TIGR04255 family)
MVADHKFEPVLPAHAIERCALTIVFSRVFDKPELEAAITEAEKTAAWSRVKPMQPEGIEITFDVATGKVAVGSGRTFNYRVGTDGPQLTLLPNMIIWQTRQYVRWEPFRGVFEQVATPIIDRLLTMSGLHAIKAEYWDRFVWTGPPETLDPWLLLRRDNGLVATAASEFGRAWHSHCGWFEPGANGARRLLNVNVDVADTVLKGDPPPKRSIGIFTLLQEDCSGGLTDLKSSASALEKLDSIHMDLKNLLNSIISDEMAARISLNAEDTQ